VLSTTWFHQGSTETSVSRRRMRCERKGGVAGIQMSEMGDLIGPERAAAVSVKAALSCPYCVSFELEAKVA